jgi:hypothetical protein
MNVKVILFAYIHKNKLLFLSNNLVVILTHNKTRHVFFVSLFVPGLLRSAGLRGQVCLHRFARKSFYACSLFRRLLACGAGSVLAVNLFTVF